MRFDNELIGGARKPSLETSYFGFSPGIFQNTTLTPLENSSKEIKALAKYYSGNHYTKERATKAAFLNELAHHNIIHLATHANAQDNASPWIAFNDQNITLDELYLTKNTASLVVLSGCNTTIGKQATGEGVMSLARGFFYSGSQSVISSLWSIDDQSTALIFKKFYKNLDSGQTKATALHKAKLHYLNSNSLSNLSPHYWASFILLGEDNQVPPSATNKNLYILIAGVLIIAFVLFISYRRKKYQA